MPSIRHQIRLFLAAGSLLVILDAGWWILQARSGHDLSPSSRIAAARASGIDDTGSAARPGRSEVPAAAGPTLRVEDVTARSKIIQPENRISGQVEPYHTATIAAEIADRIIRRPIERGDRVEKGAVLAVLFSDSAATALDQARSALAQAVAARRQAETDYQRAVVETDAARQQAQAQVNQARADQQNARAQYFQAAAGERKARSATRQQELRQAEDALAQTQSDERLARIECDRYSYLVHEGAVGQQSLDRAQAALDAAAARRQSAEQALSLAREGARQEDRDAAAAQVSASRAQIDAAQHRVEEAQATLRIANTRDTRLAVIRRQIDGLRAQEAQAREAVRQVRIALEKRTIRAPFAARVLATLADAGDVMSPGTPIARLGEIRRVKVIASVPESSRPALSLGRTVRITADALPGRTFPGRITALGFQADPRSRAFPVEVTVQNPEEILLPNMVARLRLPVGPISHRTLIPSSAVASDGTLPYVFVLRGGRAWRREVRLGAPVGDSVEVSNGLEPGEQIAATPQRLSDGACVRTGPR
jgi:RND family efflux transporter MFP subunit